MKRNYEKLLEEHRKLEEQGKGVIYASDIMQIHDMCDSDCYETLVTSLQAGIAIGYRIAKAEARKNNKAKKQLEKV